MRKKNHIYITMHLVAVLFLLSGTIGTFVANAQEPVTTGKWFDPVQYFHLDQHGDKLSQSELEAIMWEKERHITGMMIQVYSIAMVKDDPRKTSMPLTGTPSYTLYINSPATIVASCDMSVQNKLMGRFTFVANDADDSISHDVRSWVYA